MGKYELGEKLGSGGFATVWKARRRTDGKTFALKKVSCDNLDDANAALGEARMLLELDNRYIVRYHDFFLQEDSEKGGKRKLHVCHVMDYCSGGDLFTRLEMHHKKGTKIPEAELRDWGFQLLNALEYLESKRIVHRDIKLANVLFEGTSIKLGDFGISKQMTAAWARTVMGGTPLYMAPELLLKERYDTKADVWSFGCLMFELATCSLLSMKKGGVLGAMVIKDPAACTPLFNEAGARGYRGLEEVLRHCLVVDSANRKSPTELMRLPFFSPAAPPASAGPPLLTRATEAPRAGSNGRRGPDASGSRGREIDLDALPPEMRLYYQYQNGRGAADVDNPRGGSGGGGGARAAPARERGGSGGGAPAPPRDRDFQPRGRTVEELCAEADHYDKQKDWDAAEACFKAALRLAPNHARTLCNYGYWLQVNRQDLDGAERYFTLSLQADPKRTPTLCNYAYLLKAKKREREARAIFRRALELDPSHPWVVKNKTHFQ